VKVLVAVWVLGLALVAVLVLASEVKGLHPDTTHPHIHRKWTQNCSTPQDRCKTWASVRNLRNSTCHRQAQLPHQVTVLLKRT
jgi:invasion protein IalB